MQGLNGSAEACPLSKLTPDKSINGIGASDDQSYAAILAQKYNYVNTFYHKDPLLNIEDINSLAKYKPMHFIVCNDVIEHTMLPPGEVIPRLFAALEPNGILILCAPTYNLEEHIEKYPSIVDFEVEACDAGHKVKYTTRMGIVNEDSSPYFHGGPGRVLELRLLSNKALERNLVSAGFDVSSLDDDLLKRYGSWWPEQIERAGLPHTSIGKPFICRKGP